MLGSSESAAPQLRIPYPHLGIRDPRVLAIGHASIRGVALSGWDLTRAYFPRVGAAARATASAC